MKYSKRFGCLHAILFAFAASSVSQAFGQVHEPVLSLVKTEQAALLETLKQLVSIESGSRDYEGLTKLANLIAGRLKGLGGRVELVEPTEIYRMEDTPEQIGKMVRATFTGAGHRWRQASHRGRWRNTRGKSIAS